jgi:Fe-S-cluster containining protein
MSNEDQVMPSDHDELLRDWKRNAVRREDANFRFLRSLKMVDDPDEVDELARELHADTFRRIDCTRCANCCKTIAPGLNDADIDRIAAHLGMAREAFSAAYLTFDQLEGGHVMKAIPCPFLGEDDRCTIYDVRPKCCRTYPNTDQEGFTGRSHQHTANTLVCPAVYHIVKAMRDRWPR